MIKFAYFGSNDFSKLLLFNLLKNGLKPQIIIAPERKPQGRKKLLLPSPVEELALKENIEVMTPINLNEENFLTKLKNLNLQFGLLSGYGKIIPLKLLQLFPNGFLNLHPSLLPKLRGATPIQTAILNNEETGVTLFIMDEKIDHGPIIAQKKVEVDISQLNYLQLSQILAKAGADLISQSINDYLEGKIIPVSQNEELATYCHKITKEDEKINWLNEATFIDRQVRALNPNPSTYTLFKNKILKIIQGFPHEETDVSLNKKIGEVFIFEDQMAVKCKNGFYVILILKPEGKKEMKSSDFIRGNKNIIGEILG